MTGLLTRLALDCFTREELAQIRLAAKALSPGDSGIVILPGKSELYLLTRTREGVKLDLATEEQAARVMGGALGAGRDKWASTRRNPSLREVCCENTQDAREAATVNIVSNEDMGQQTGETGSERRFCTARTKAGRVCGAPALRNDPAGLCWTHSPTIAEQRRESQRRGGSTTTKRRALLLGRVAFCNGAAVLAFREALTSAVLTGQVQAARAGVAAQIAKDAEGALFGASLEARVDAIEGQLRELATEEADADDGQ